MQVFRPSMEDDAALVGWGASVLFATSEAEAGPTVRRLAGMGAHVTVQRELYDVLSQLLDDPKDADMLVIDCDCFGGIAVGRRAFAILAEGGLRLPVILLSSACTEQRLGTGRDSAMLLRAPASAVALRIAFESAFQGRLRPIVP